MYPITKIAFLGGDRRTEAMLEGVHRSFPEAQISLWGARDVTPPSFVRTEDTWQEAFLGAQVGILPLPITRDGVTLASHAAQTVQLESLCRFLRPGSLLLGGMVPPILLRLAGENAVCFTDYYDEAVQTRNAVPTAEGAIAIAVNELPVTLSETTALITGYGRCAKALASRLKLLGTQVIVTARRPLALAEASCDGCGVIPLTACLTDPPACHVLFNTVPAPLLTGTFLAKCAPGTLIVELSDGIPADTVLPEQVRLIRAPGLPGKTAPITAGGILTESITEKIRLWQKDGAVPYAVPKSCPKEEPT